MRPARPDDFRLPDLRIVPVESLIPHERHDPQRLEPLVRRFREQAVLRNPPVVARLPNSEPGKERWIVLDGANRSTAALEAGLPHMVVQVVPYEDPMVHLSTWHHALSELPKADFEASCRAIPGLECRNESILHARAMLARREILAYAVHADAKATAFRGGGSLEEHNELLNALVDTYRERVRSYRTSTESFEVARERHPDVTILVVFPHFEPAEVLELAGSGSRLPAGITRHLVRWRALHLDVPLDRLADESHDLERKNAWLQEWIQEKWTERQVRFYEESTVLFDE